MMFFHGDFHFYVSLESVTTNHLNNKPIQENCRKDPPVGGSVFGTPKWQSSRDVKGASNTYTHRVFGCLGLAWKIRDEISKQMCLDFLIEFIEFIELYFALCDISICIIVSLKSWSVLTYRRYSY